MEKPGVDDPIADVEAAGLFQPLKGVSVLVALSGGADSVCLLWLLKRWNGASALAAATVDHGLRSGSAEEAIRTGAFAKTLGVPHRVLTWQGDKPDTGIEAKARDARYALLDRHARETGAEVLATAHTLDDQAETVLMRLAAGSGPAGLAGMRVTGRRPDGLMHARPLLSVPKSRLLATLRAEGIGWSEDPMNRDGAFARVRLRQASGALSREGLTPERLATLARRMARTEDALVHAADAAWSVHATCADEKISLARAALDLPEEILLRLLRRAIAGDAPPVSLRFERLESLADALLAAAREGRALVRTLGGKRVALDREGVVITIAASRRSD